MEFPLGNPTETGVQHETHQIALSRAGCSSDVPIAVFAGQEALSQPKPEYQAGSSPLATEADVSSNNQSKSAADDAGGIRRRWMYFERLRQLPTVCCVKALPQTDWTSPDHQGTDSLSSRALPAAHFDQHAELANQRRDDRKRWISSPTISSHDPPMPSGICMEQMKPERGSSFRRTKRPRRDEYATSEHLLDDVAGRQGEVALIDGDSKEDHQHRGAGYTWSTSRARARLSVNGRFTEP